nr:hypothetical protein [Tanacetum cinerariifolium]
MDVTRETGVIGPTDLPILVPSSPEVPLRATPTQFSLLVDVDTQESVVELLDVAQVSNAARNYKILHKRDDDDTERPDKRQRSGDRHQPTSQQSSHRSHGHHNDRHGSDRHGGNENHHTKESVVELQNTMLQSTVIPIKLSLVTVS